MMRGGRRVAQAAIALSFASGLLAGCGEESPESRPEEPRPYDTVIDTVRELEQFDNLTYRGFEIVTRFDDTKVRARVTWVVVPGEKTCQKTSVTKRGVETWRQVGRRSYLRLDGRELRNRRFSVEWADRLAGKWMVFPEDGGMPGPCEFEALFEENQGWEKAKPFDATVRGEAGHRYRGGVFGRARVFVLAVDGAPRVLRIEDRDQGKLVGKVDLVTSNSSVRLRAPRAPLDGSDYFES